MGDFFRGWRRKLGVATLVIALGFIGIWIRSKNLSDAFISPAGRSMCGMIFNPFGLELFIVYFEDPSNAPRFLPSGWDTARIQSGSYNSSVEVGDNVRIWSRLPKNSYNVCRFSLMAHRCYSFWVPSRFKSVSRFSSMRM